jgi:hypothetical protein
MKKRTKFYDFYVVYNIKTAEIRLTRTKATLATITGIGHTRLASITERKAFDDFVIFPVKEE